MKEWLTAKSELEQEYYMSRIPGDNRHVALKKRPQKTAASRNQAASTLMKKKKYTPVTLRVIPIELEVIMTSNPKQQTEDYSISKVNNIQEEDWY